MKKLDPKTICEKFNLCRLQNLKKSFDVDELEKVLASFGIKKHIVNKLRLSNVFVIRVEAHNRKLYSFMETPLYFAQLASILKSEPKKHRPAEKFTEAEAIAYLEKKGYKVTRPVIDWERLRKENPDLIAKYTSWE